MPVQPSTTAVDDQHATANNSNNPPAQPIAAHAQLQHLLKEDEQAPHSPTAAHEISFDVAHPFHVLPREILVHIFLYFTGDFIFSLQQV